MKHIVLITGGASGTGYAIAERFARQGWTTLLASRDPEKARLAAERLARESGAPSLGVSLSPDHMDDVERVFADLAKKGLSPATLVLNAANLGDKLGYNYDPLTVDLVLWAEVIQTNIVWNFHVARTAARAMTAEGAGAIVFVSSNTSRRAIRSRTAYIASKGGINALSRALALDLGGKGVRVNALLPGAIKTARWETYTEEYRRSKVECVPLQEIASGGDIANAAYYLGSEESGNVTGVELVVDGGMDAQLRTS